MGLLFILLWNCESLILRTKKSEFPKEKKTAYGTHKYSWKYLLYMYKVVSLHILSYTKH